MNEVKEVVITYTMSEEFIDKNTEVYSNVKSVTVIELNKLISIIGLFTINMKKFYDINGNLLLIDGGGRIISIEDDELYTNSFVKDVYKDHTQESFDDLTIEEVTKSKKKPKIKISGNKEIDLDNKNKEKNKLDKNIGKNNHKDKDKNIQKSDNSVINKDTNKKIDINKDKVIAKPVKNILYVDSDIDVVVMNEQFNGQSNIITSKLINTDETSFKPIKIEETIGGYKIDVKYRTNSYTFINTSVSTNGVYAKGSLRPKIVINVSDKIIDIFDIKSTSSDITVGAKTKKARLISVSGNIYINDVEEMLYCQSVSGNIYARINPKKNSEVYMKNVSGNIEALLKNVSDIRLSHSTVSGKVNNSFREELSNKEIIKANVQLKTVSGNIIIKNDL